jgi:hypothetical protein
MPDLDTGVVDLCRHTPRKWKSKMQPLRHTTSMPPNAALRRTQDKRQTIEPSHSYQFNSTAHTLTLPYGSYIPAYGLG